jgi:hypothetical protein
MDSKNGIKALVLIALAVGAAAPVAAAKPRPATKTPVGWSYDIRDGKRVPKGQREVKADGSWREVIRQGDCVTIREKTRAGEYRETRQC